MRRGEKYSLDRYLDNKSVDAEHTATLRRLVGARSPTEWEKAEFLQYQQNRLSRLMSVQGLPVSVYERSPSAAGRASPRSPKPAAAKQTVWLRVSCKDLLSWGDMHRGGSSGARPSSSGGALARSPLASAAASPKNSNNNTWTSGLLSVFSSSSINPYVSLSLRKKGQQKTEFVDRTESLEGHNNPQFAHEFRLERAGDEELRLVFSVYDQDDHLRLTGPRLLGCAYVSLTKHLAAQQKSPEVEYFLLDPENKQLLATPSHEQPKLILQAVVDSADTFEPRQGSVFSPHTTQRVFQRKLLVRTPDGRMLSLAVNLQDKVAVLKTLIQEKEGVRTQDQQLFIDNTSGGSHGSPNRSDSRSDLAPLSHELRDHLTLAECGVDFGHTLQLQVITPVAEAAPVPVVPVEEQKLQSVEVALALRDLPNMDIDGASDPIVVVYINQTEASVVRPGSPTVAAAATASAPVFDWKFIDTTEVVEDNNAPVFRRRIVITGFPQQTVSFAIYDIDDYVPGQEFDVMHKKPIGGVQVKLSELVASNGRTSKHSIVADNAELATVISDLGSVLLIKPRSIEVPTTDAAKQELGRVNIKVTARGLPAPRGDSQLNLAVTLSEYDFKRKIYKQHATTDVKLLGKGALEFQKRLTLAGEAGKFFTPEAQLMFQIVRLEASGGGASAPRSPSKSSSRVSSRRKESNDILAVGYCTGHSLMTAHDNLFELKLEGDLLKPSDNAHLLLQMFQPKERDTARVQDYEVSVQCSGLPVQTWFGLDDRPLVGMFLLDPNTDIFQPLARTESVPQSANPVFLRKMICKVAPDAVDKIQFVVFSEQLQANANRALPSANALGGADSLVLDNGVAFATVMQSTQFAAQMHSQPLALSLTDRSGNTGAGIVSVTWRAVSASPRTSRFNNDELLPLELSLSALNLFPLLAQNGGEPDVVVRVFVRGVCKNLPVAEARKRDRKQAPSFAPPDNAAGGTAPMPWVLVHQTETSRGSNPTYGMHFRLLTCGSQELQFECFDTVKGEVTASGLLGHARIFVWELLDMLTGRYGEPTASDNILAFLERLSRSPSAGAQGGAAMPDLGVAVTQKSLHTTQLALTAADHVRKALLDERASRVVLGARLFTPASDKPPEIKRLSIKVQCTDLPQPGWFRNLDAVVQLLRMDDSPDHTAMVSSRDLLKSTWRVISDTEILRSTDPTFEQELSFDYSPEENTELKIAVLNVKDSSYVDRATDASEIGYAMISSELLFNKLRQQTKLNLVTRGQDGQVVPLTGGASGKTPAHIFLTVSDAGAANEKVHKVEVLVKCENLPANDIASPSDPMVCLYTTKQPSSTRGAFHSMSDRLEDKPSPEFLKTFVINYSEMSETYLEFVAYDDDSEKVLGEIKDEDELASVKLTLSELLGLPPHESWRPQMDRFAHLPSAPPASHLYMNTKMAASNKNLLAPPPSAASSFAFPPARLASQSSFSAAASTPGGAQSKTAPFVPPPMVHQSTATLFVGGTPSTPKVGGAQGGASDAHLAPYVPFRDLLASIRADLLGQQGYGEEQKQGGRAPGSGLAAARQRSWLLADCKPRTFKMTYKRGRQNGETTITFQARPLPRPEPVPREVELEVKLACSDVIKIALMGEPDPMVQLWLGPTVSSGQAFDYSQFKKIDQTEMIRDERFPVFNHVFKFKAFTDQRLLFKVLSDDNDRPVNEETDLIGEASMLTHDLIEGFNSRVPFQLTHSRDPNRHTELLVKSSRLVLDTRVLTARDKYANVGQLSQFRLDVSIASLPQKWRIGSAPKLICCLMAKNQDTSDWYLAGYTETEDCQSAITFKRTLEVDYWSAGDNKLELRFLEADADQPNGACSHVLSEIIDDEKRLVGKANFRRNQFVDGFWSLDQTPVQLPQGRGVLPLMKDGKPVASKTASAMVLLNFAPINERGALTRGRVDLRASNLPKAAEKQVMCAVQVCDAAAAKNGGDVQRYPVDGTIVERTELLRNNLNPHWLRKITLDSYERVDRIVTFRVITDVGALIGGKSKMRVGVCRVPMSELIKTPQQSLPLLDDAGAKIENAVLHIKYAQKKDAPSAPAPSAGNLTLVVRISNLIRADVWSQSDPVVRVERRKTSEKHETAWARVAPDGPTADECGETEWLDDTHNCTFDTRLRIANCDDTTELRFNVYDFDTRGQKLDDTDLLGRVSVLASTLLASEPGVGNTFLLTNPVDAKYAAMLKKEDSSITLTVERAANNAAAAAVVEEVVDVPVPVDVKLGLELQLQCIPQMYANALVALYTVKPGSSGFEFVAQTEAASRNFSPLFERVLELSTLSNVDVELFAYDSSSADPVADPTKSRVPLIGRSGPISAGMLKVGEPIRVHLSNNNAPVSDRTGAPTILTVTSVPPIQAPCHKVAICVRTRNFPAPAQPGITTPQSGNRSRADSRVDARSTSRKTSAPGRGSTSARSVPKLSSPAAAAASGAGGNRPQALQLGLLHNKSDAPMVDPSLLNANQASVACALYAQGMRGASRQSLIFQTQTERQIHQLSTIFNKTLLVDHYDGIDRMLSFRCFAASSQANAALCPTPANTLMGCDMTLSQLLPAVAGGAEAIIKTRGSNVGQYWVAPLVQQWAEKCSDPPVSNLLVQPAAARSSHAPRPELMVFAKYVQTPSPFFVDRTPLFVELTLSCRALIHLQVTSPSDPKVYVYAMKEVTSPDGQRLPPITLGLLGQTEMIQDQHDCTFDTRIVLKGVTGDQLLRIDVNQADTGEQEKCIGQVCVTLWELLDEMQLLQDLLQQEALAAQAAANAPVNRHVSVEETTKWLPLRYQQLPEQDQKLQEAHSLVGVSVRLLTGSQVIAMPGQAGGHDFALRIRASCNNLPRKSMDDKSDPFVLLEYLDNTQLQWPKLHTNPDDPLLDKLIHSCALEFTPEATKRATTSQTEMMIDRHSPDFARRLELDVNSMHDTLLRFSVYDGDEDHNEEGEQQVQTPNLLAYAIVPASQLRDAGVGHTITLPMLFPEGRGACYGVGDDGTYGRTSISLTVVNEPLPPRAPGNKFEFTFKARNLPSYIVGNGRMFEPDTALFVMMHSPYETKYKRAAYWQHKGETTPVEKSHNPEYGGHAVVLEYFPDDQQMVQFRVFNPKGMENNPAALRSRDLIGVCELPMVELLQHLDSETPYGLFEYGSRQPIHGTDRSGRGAASEVLVTAHTHPWTPPEPRHTISIKLGIDRPLQAAGPPTRETYLIAIVYKRRVVEPSKGQWQLIRHSEAAPAALFMQNTRPSALTAQARSSSLLMDGSKSPPSTAEWLGRMHFCEPLVLQDCTAKEFLLFRLYEHQEGKASASLEPIAELETNVGDLLDMAFFKHKLTSMQSAASLSLPATAVGLRVQLSLLQTVDPSNPASAGAGAAGNNNAPPKTHAFYMRNPSHPQQ